MISFFSIQRKIKLALPILALSALYCTKLSASGIDKCCKKDDDQPEAEVTTSACVQGGVTATLAAGAGGYTPPGVVAPTNPGIRTVSGTASNYFRYSPNRAVVQILPGKEYSVNWQKTGASVVGSLHTRITPKNLQEGFKVQIDNGDGKGWRDQSHIDNAGGIANPSAMVHKFRVIGPVSDAGKISSVDLTPTKFGMKSNSATNGLALIAYDNDGDGDPDLELSRAKVSIDLGSALENGVPVTAGQLIFRSGLYVGALQTFSITPALLSYEGPSNPSIQIITSSNGNIRQIKTSRALANVVTINSNKFEVKVYAIGNVGNQPGTGQPFGVTGTPISRCVFENPGSFSSSPFSGSFPYGVKITKFEDEIQTSEVSVGGKFSLQKFQCVIKRDSEIESIETNKTYYPVGSTLSVGPYDYPVTTEPMWYREETRELRRNGSIAAKSIKRYILHSIGGWGSNPLGGYGDLLISSKEFFGSGSNDYLLTEQWTNIHTTTTSTFGPFNPGAFGKPAFIVHPDGSWERYVYNINGQISKTYRPYKGLPASPLDATDTNCIVHTSDTKADPYSVPGPTLPPGFLEALEDLDGTNEQKINGVTVSKSDTTYSKVTVNGQPAVRATLRSYSGASSYIDKITDVYHHTASATMRGKNAVISDPAGERLESVYEIGDFNDITRSFTASSSGNDTREITTQGTSTNPEGIANKTYRDIKIYREDGQIVQTSKQIYTGGTTYENASTTDYYYSELGEQIRTEMDGRVIEETEITGPLSIIKDEAGVETTILKDDLGRIVSQSKAGGPTTLHSYTGLTETVTRGALNKVIVQDFQGRVKSETSETGATKSYSYPNGGRDTETTWPGGLKTLTTNYPGGLLQSKTNTSGSKNVSLYYAYTTETTGDQTTKESIGASNSSRWTQVTTDWTGRKKSAVRPSPDGTGNVTVTTSYNSQGLPQTETYSTNTGLMPKRFDYDPLGRVWREGIDMDNNNALDPSSADQITEHDYSFEKIGGLWYQVEETREYQANNSNLYSVLNISKERLHGSNGGFASSKLMSDENGRTTTELVSFDRPNKTEIRTVTQSDLSGTFVQTKINGLLVGEKTPVSDESYQYDSLERLWKTINNRSGAVTTYAYDPATGEKTSVTDHLGRNTTYVYYSNSHKNAGQLKSSGDPLSKKLYLEYNDAGQEIRRWGDTSYPVQKSYSSYGELKTLTTYRGGSGWTGSAWPTGSEGTGDTTTWQYFGPTGLLEFKQDAAGRKVNYTWKANGKPATRLGSRSITTTYSYNGAGGSGTL